MSAIKRHIETLAETIQQTDPWLYMDAFDFIYEGGDQADMDEFMAYTENATDPFKAQAALLAADHAVYLERQQDEQRARIEAGL